MEPFWVKKYKLDHKWTLCIEVFCFPNPGLAMIRYIIYNNSLKHTLEIKKYVCGTTTNNEVYYISLVEGLKEEKTCDTNYILVYTNSQLICNQMQGIYQVRKDNLKHKKKHLQNRHLYWFPTRSFGGGDIDNNSMLAPTPSSETSPNTRSLDIFWILAWYFILKDWNWAVVILAFF